MAKITTSKRAQIRKHQRNTENSSPLNSKKRCSKNINSLRNPNEVIEIRIYNLNCMTTKSLNLPSSFF